MADHALSHHGGKISADPTQAFKVFVDGSSNKPLYHHPEECVRIKVVSFNFKYLNMDLDLNQVGGITIFF